MSGTSMRTCEGVAMRDDADVVPGPHLCGILETTCDPSTFLVTFTCVFRT